MMLAAQLPFLGIVKTCEDEEVVKRLKIWFQRIPVFYSDVYS